MPLNELTRILEGRDIRFDPDDSNPDYVGTNHKENAATTRSDWVIRKFTKSGSNVTRVQTKVGTWDGRVALFS